MLKGFKFDKGWKFLLYFDIILPALLFLLAWLVKAPRLAMLFHSYEIFVINPIPNFLTLTGIVGLLFHGGVLAYTLFKRDYKDFGICLALSLMVAAFFLLEINYLILKPLEFAAL